MPAPIGRLVADANPEVSFAGQYRANDHRRSQDFGNRFGVSDYYFEERQLNDFHHGGAPPGGTLRSLKQQARPQSWSCSRAEARERKAELAPQVPPDASKPAARPSTATGPRLSSSISEIGTEASLTTKTSSYGTPGRGRGMSMREALAQQAAQSAELRSSSAPSPCKKQIASAKPGWEWCTMRQAVRPIASEPAGCEMGLVHAPGAYHHSSTNKLQRPRSTPSLVSTRGSTLSPKAGDASALSISSPPSPTSPKTPGARRGRGKHGQFETSMELSHTPLDTRHYRDSLANHPPRWQKDKGFASFKF